MPCTGSWLVVMWQTVTHPAAASLWVMQLRAGLTIITTIDRGLLSTFCVKLCTYLRTLVVCCDWSVGAACHSQGICSAAEAEELVAREMPIDCCGMFVHG